MHADTVDRMIDAFFGDDRSYGIGELDDYRRRMDDVLTVALSSPQEPVAWPVRIWDDEQKIFREPTDADMAARASPVVPVAAKAGAEGWMLVPEYALKWLNGEGPDLDGKWFGCDVDFNSAPLFWWRERFFAMLAAPTCEGEGT